MTKISLKKFLAIIDSNKFNYKNKTDIKFKYIDIRDLARKGLNKLNQIKNAEIIRCKKHTPKHKELLNLFNDLLDVILTDKTLKSKSQKDNTLISSKEENENEKEKNNDKENENEKENETEKEKENAKENDKTLMPSN